MRGVSAAAMVFLGCAGGAVAQPAGPTPGLPDTVRLGTLATLGAPWWLRKRGWAFPLARAGIPAATRAPQPADPALRSAPGSDTAIGALSYAAAEALEDFAEASPAVACDPLRHGTALDEADRAVEEFRRRVAAASGS